MARELSNGRYQLQEPIGKGGMADVYRAWDRQGRCVVAVKEMRLDPRHLPEDQKKAFAKEVEILEELALRPVRSPHIPTFYASFKENGRSYLVMQFIEGKTLKEVMGRGRLPQEKVVWYAIELCQALLYLHQQPLPVIFRDLKPDNIMIGKNGQVYLIDFGIARRYSLGKQHDTLLFGTPGYAPPELCDEEQTERRSDLFSLGATLHHCLTGQSPSGSGFAPVRNHHPQVSPRFDRLIMQLVATQKEHRPADAKVVMRELRAIQQEISPVPFHDAATERAESFFVPRPQWDKRFIPLMHTILPLVAWLSTQRQKASPWFRHTCIPFLRSLAPSLGGWLVTAWQARSHDYQHMMLLSGLLCGTALWSTGFLFLFDASLYMVLYLLVLLLLLIVLVTYLSPGTSTAAHRLLSPVILGALLLCFLLLAQYDILHITIYTINQILSVILSLALIILTISSLIRPVDSLRWLDYSAIIMLALWEITLWDMLGPSAIQHLLFADDTNQMINWLVLGILVAIAFFSLLSIKSSSDRIASFYTVLLSLPALFLQYVFGMSALASLKVSMHWNTGMLNEIFIILCFALNLIALKLPNERAGRTSIPWHCLARLPLLLLTLSALCSQQFVNTQMQPFSLPSITGISPLVAQLSLLINIGSGILCILVIYGWRRNGQLLLSDHIILIGIGLICIIIDASHKADILQGGMSILKGHMLLYIPPAIATVLLFVVLAVLLHLVERASWNELLFSVLAGILGTSRRLLMLLCAGFALLMLFFTLDNSEDWDRHAAWLNRLFVSGQAQPLPPSFGHHLLFLALLLLAVLTFVKLVIAFFLPWEGASDRNNRRKRRKRPFIEFDRLDYILLFCTILSLLVVWNVPEQQEVPVSLTALWLKFATGSLSSMIGIASLLIVTAISLLWLRRSLEARTRDLLRFLLSLSLLCLLCSFAGILFSYLEPAIDPLLLTGLLLLIGSMFLVLLTELKTPGIR
jgi:serine/threonine protein kinase